MRRVFASLLGLILIGCQPTPAVTPTQTIPSTQTPRPTSTTAPIPTATSAPVLTPTVSSAELIRRASPICENAFSTLVETGPLTPPFAVLKKTEHADAPSWELSQGLPHLGSLSAAEVKTVFCVSESRTQTGTFTDGSAAYQLLWDLRIVAWPGGKVIGRRTFAGLLPPKEKELASSSGEGPSPFKGFAAWVFNQVDHPDFLYFSDAITSLALSPDGRLAGFGTAIANEIVDRDYQAKVLLFQPGDTQTDLRTSAFVQAFEGHQGMVTSLAFSPNGNILASSGYDRFVKFWDMAKGRLLGQVNTTETPNALAFSVDGAALAVASNLEILLIDTTTRQVLSSIPQAGGEDVAFSPDGERIYLEASGSIKIIDADSGNVLLSFPDPFSLVPTTSVSADGSTVNVTYETPGSVDGFALSPDGTQIATYTIDRAIDASSGAENVRLAIWDAQTGKYASEVRFSGDMIHTLEFSPDGSLLAIGNQNEIWLWDTSKWQIKENFSGHTGEIVDLVFTSQEEKLLSASRDGTVRVWSLAE